MRTAIPSVISAQNFPLFSGTQLPRCVSDEQQCCTADYIERVEGKVIEILQEFLAEEFDDVIEDYRDDIENVFDCKYMPLQCISSRRNCVSTSYAKNDDGNGIK